MAREHRHRPRQEISRCLKYIIFLVNFIFWLCGIICTILGVYLYAKDFRLVLEAIDFFFNPSILLILCGCVIFIVAFLGCTGALRENVCMLKAFSLCLFFTYVSLVILAFVVFIFFYADTKTGLSIQALLHTAVSKYHENENMRELMDYLQSTLGCCGASSQGYKDWNNNPLYNCSAANEAPEQCGVPPSCCKQRHNSPTVISPVAPTVAIPAVAESLEVALDNPRCGFHTQDKAITDLQHILYTDGCLQPLQRAFEANAVVIGAVIGAIIVPVCVSVTLSNILARQIERQRYLLAKEARKEDRRRRRNKSKHKQTVDVPVAKVSKYPSEKAPHHRVRTANEKIHFENECKRKRHLPQPNEFQNGFSYQTKPIENHTTIRGEPIYEKVKRTKRDKKLEQRGKRSSGVPHRKSISNHTIDRSRLDDHNFMSNYKGPIIVELP